MNARLFNRSIEHINKHGFLLVFPIKGQNQPQSLWSQLYPDTEMRWNWDENADPRVSELWNLREQLASSKQIVYGKFFRGRATLLSKDFFAQLLSLFDSCNYSTKSRDAKLILEALEIDSPLSTKQLKEVTGLRGRLLESTQSRALKVLWNHLQIVGVGEIDDGAFPSLAHASTRLVFESVWNQALTIEPLDAMVSLLQYQESELLIDYLHTQIQKEN